MSFAISYSLRLDFPLDPSDGPAAANPFVAALAGDGILIGGDLAGTAYQNIISQGVNYSHPGNPGGNAAAAQISGGNIAVAYEVNGGGLNGSKIAYTIETALGGAVLAPVTINDTGSSNADIAALAGGGFVIVNQDLAGIFGPASDIDLRIYNNAGTFLLEIPYVGGTNRNPSICALADGGFAVAWEKAVSGETEIWYAVYEANGAARLVPTSLDNGGTINRNVDICASGDGFVIVYEDNGLSVTFDTDLNLRKFSADGASIIGFEVAQDVVDDVNPRVTMLTDDVLALSYGRNSVSAADTDTIIKLFDANTLQQLATQVVDGGEPLTDDTDFAAIAGYGLAQLAVLHRNNTDNDIDGQSLQLVRTTQIEVEGPGTTQSTAGDDAVDIMTVTSFAGGKSSMQGGGNNDVLTGGPGIDTLIGGTGSDVMNGGGGDDLIILNPNDLGVDTVTGGAGAGDQLDCGTPSRAVWINLTAGAGAEVRTRDAPDLLSGVWRPLAELTDDSIESAHGTSLDDEIRGNASANNLMGGNGGDALYGGTGFDFLEGENGDDALFGEDGDDALDGGSGDDRLSGGAGFDTLIGGADFDTADWSAATGAIAVTLDSTGNGDTGAVAGIGQDVFGGIEAMIGGSAGDRLTGNALANTIAGGGGNDTLDGGSGDDRLEGGLGNDIFHIDDAGDTAVELAGAGSGYDSVRTTLSVYTLAANVERLYTDTTAGIVAVGNALANIIYGNNGDDKFRDYNLGTDAFSGGNGSDSMYYTGTGAAIIDFVTNVHGGSALGDAFASVENFFGSNTAGDTMTGGAGRVIFNGQGGNDQLSGGSNIDSLYGGAGLDTMNGNGGVDALYGGAQNDTLTGGAAKDYFVYAETAASGGWGTDTVTDFQDGLDVLKFANAAADAFADFAIAGNGTANVTLTLAAAPANTIALHGAAPITITAADFLFF